MKKTFIYDKFFAIIIALVFVTFTSCSNEDSLTASNDDNIEGITVLANESDLANFFATNAIYDSTIYINDEVTFITDKDITAQINKTKSSLSTRAGGTEPLAIDFSTVGVNEMIQAKTTMVMIDGTLAKALSINAGMHAVIPVQGIRRVYMSVGSMTIVGFAQRDSPKMGCLSAVTNSNGIASATGVRNYSSTTLFTNGKPTGFEMVTHYLYVVASNGGGKINKWYPFHPDDTEWNFSVIVMI